MQGRAPLEILDGDRERDGLRGPVRRVRTEVARLILKAGALVEGRRSLLEITLYDPTGRRVANETYPLVNTPVGQETHSYDDQGQLVETVTRDAQGAVLSRTTYAYEYDAVGNWTKMTASVAVIESGEVRLEPHEVTYRAISYYHGDRTGALEATRAGAAVHPTARHDSAQGTLLRLSSHRPDTEIKSGGSETASAAAEADDLTLEVGLINDKALNLPPPSYPIEGRRLPKPLEVQVEVVVDETGRVLTARARGGSAALRASAEDAARTALFLPFVSGGRPVKAKGLIMYSFPFGR